MNRGKAFDDDAIAVVDHARLLVIELVDFDLRAGVGQGPRRVSVSQAKDSIWRRTKCSMPYLGSGPDGP